MNKLCKNTVISSAVTLVTVDGVDTLVIDTPAATYRDGDCLTLIVAQNFPAGVPIEATVALGIGGVTDPVYPLVRCDCSPVTASAIRTRGIYKLVVNTTATGANLRVVSGLCCAPRNTVPVIPVPAATTAP